MSFRFAVIRLLDLARSTFRVNGQDLTELSALLEDVLERGENGQYNPATDVAVQAASRWIEVKFEVGMASRGVSTLRALLGCDARLGRWRGSCIRLFHCHFGPR